ncbi:MAG: discoidin domain-containing protein [Planctomycetota bacterium]|jgi:hypothetical protein
MLSKWRCLACIVLVVGLTGRLPAVDWTGAVGSDWYNAANWSGGVPDAGEDAVIDSSGPLTWPVIEGGTTNTAQLRVGYTANYQGELTVTGGATLNVDGELRIGRKSNDGTGQAVGILNVSGETTRINVTQRIEHGRHGFATLNMSGGYLHCDAELRMAYRFDATSTVNLSGGTIDLGGDPGITVYANDGVPDTALIDISGGLMTLAGNQVSLIDGFISDGIIIGYGGEGTVSVDFDAASGVTTISAIGGPSASEPNPVSEKKDVPRDALLSWKPGTGAVSHDVYFGKTFAVVDQATTTLDPLGVYQGRVNLNTFAVPERLEFGQTYYWRVDAVSASNAISKGDVWSFAAERFAYAIENVIATASSSEDNKGPENTVNGSGLDDTGLLHGNDSVGKMWLSSADGAQPTWIEYEFDRACKVHEMWVWNSNDSLESLIGLGFKEVVIEYSSNGTDFVTLGTTHEFARAPGTAGYAHDITIDLGGVAAKHVRLTANSNWGGIFNQFGLSEVRFFHIPVHAREPGPAAGQIEVDLDQTLSWQPGREAAQHDVYFGSDQQAVSDGTSGTTTVNELSHGPLALDLGTTYYWRVDEVNDAEEPSVWQGELWSFTTQQYLTVDDFESYNDIDPPDPESQRIFEAWIDGFGSTTNGALVGNELPPYTERNIVHSGDQSMPFSYDNALKYSEATMTLSSQRDWTVRGAEELAIWLRGNPASASMFAEGPVGTYTLTARSDNISGQSDSFHFVYKQLSGPGSITIKVESVTETSSSAKAGVMIRESLTPDSKYAMTFSRPDGGVRFRRRTETGGETTNSVDSHVSVPHWVKLERDAAGLLTGSRSSDGITFVPFDDLNLGTSDSVQMGASVYVGIALSSNNPEETCTAMFSEIATTGTVMGEWQSADIGIEGNAAEPMYVSIANSTGAPAVVYHDEPDAATIDTWTKWIIPLQMFADQGVNLTDVDKISIGFGDKDNLIAGGSGIVYFDDIGIGKSVP